MKEYAFQFCLWKAALQVFSLPVVSLAGLFYAVRAAPRQHLGCYLDHMAVTLPGGDYALHARRYRQHRRGSRHGCGLLC